MQMLDLVAVFESPMKVVQALAKDGDEFLKYVLKVRQLEMFLCCVCVPFTTPFPANRL
jgi:hypothetical protein